jgi:plasmid replication initiation protein
MNVFELKEKEFWWEHRNTWRNVMRSDEGIATADITIMRQGRPVHQEADLSELQAAGRASSTGSSPLKPSNHP